MYDSIRSACLWLAEVAGPRIALLAAQWTWRRLWSKPMIAHAAAHDLLTLGQVAAELGITATQVKSLFEQGLLPPALRVGRWRVVPRDELPKVRVAAVKAGYLAA